MKLRALDLFCCAGGASMGLHNAGFEVVGVDIVARKRYPFESSCPDHHKLRVFLDFVSVIIGCRPNFSPSFAPHKSCDIRVCVAIFEHFAIYRLHMMHFFGIFSADFWSSFIDAAVVDWQVAALADEWTARHFVAGSRTYP